MSYNYWSSSGNYPTSYGEEQRVFSTGKTKILFLLLILFSYSWPNLLNPGNLTLLTIDSTLIIVIALIGLNIMMGLAGLASLGHAALVGVGAYTLAGMGITLGMQSDWIIHLWPLCILICGLVTAIFAMLMGLPSLRLKEIYWLMVTLAFQIIFEWAIRGADFFNQGETITIPRVYWLGEKVIRKEHYLFWYYVILTFVIISTWMMFNLMRTRYGRAFIAVRDHEKVADSMGMVPGVMKLKAFALAGFFAGVAGGLKAFMDRGVGIETFGLMASVEYLAALVVGGMGTLIGNFLGPAAIQFLEYGVDNFSQWLNSVTSANLNIAAFKPISFGLVIILFLIFQPHGLSRGWEKIRIFIGSWPLKSSEKI